jgi:hypothetical protein
VTKLAETLDGLFLFLQNAGQTIPRLEVRILELGADTATDDRGRLLVRRTDYRSAIDYEDRFDELLALGLPWLNVSFYGEDDGHAIVVVEVPRTRVQRSSTTSINFSGPSAAVLAHGGDASFALAIE